MPDFINGGGSPSQWLHSLPAFGSQPQWQAPTPTPGAQPQRQSSESVSMDDSPLQGKSGINPKDGRTYGEKMSDRPVLAGADFSHYTQLDHHPRGKPENIFGDFSQWGANNCLSVAVIKLAMQELGKSPLDIFKSVKETPQGYEIVLRNGESTYLSKAEFKQASIASDLRGEDPTTITYANFIGAVNAKRYQETGTGSFEEALKIVNGGGSGAESTFQRLGIRELVEPVPIDELVNGRTGIFQSGSHIAIAVGGHEERWGKRGDAPPTHSIHQAFAFKR